MGNFRITHLTATATFLSGRRLSLTTDVTIAQQEGDEHAMFKAIQQLSGVLMKFSQDNADPISLGAVQIDSSQA